MFRKFAAIINEVALIKQIAVGLVIGILLALYVPKAVPVVTIFGDLFVKALKGVAPVLVFFLVMNAMAKKKSGGEANMKPIIGLCRHLLCILSWCNPVLPGTYHSAPAGCRC